MAVADLVHKGAIVGLLGISAVWLSFIPRRLMVSWRSGLDHSISALRGREGMSAALLFM